LEKNVTSSLIGVWNEF